MHDIIYNRLMGCLHNSGRQCLPTGYLHSRNSSPSDRAPSPTPSNEAAPGSGRRRKISAGAAHARAATQ
jgi:hypothetical protein